MHQTSFTVLHMLLLFLALVVFGLKLFVWIIHQRPKYKFKDIFFFSELRILKSKTERSERAKHYQNALSFVLIFIIGYLILAFFVLKIKLKTLL
jgi:hypothetical protein